jgi:hypothetical protein
MWKAEEQVVFGEHLLMFSKAKQKQKNRNPIQSKRQLQDPYRTHTPHPPQPLQHRPPPYSAKPGLFCLSISFVNFWGGDQSACIYTPLKHPSLPLGTAMGNLPIAVANCTSGWYWVN